MQSTEIPKRILYVIAFVTFAVLLFAYHIKVDAEWNPDRMLMTLYHRGEVPVGLVYIGNALFRFRGVHFDQAWLFGILFPVGLFLLAAYHTICLWGMVRKRH